MDMVCTNVKGAEQPLSSGACFADTVDQRVAQSRIEYDRGMRCALLLECLSGRSRLNTGLPRRVVPSLDRPALIAVQTIAVGREREEVSEWLGMIHLGARHEAESTPSSRVAASVPGTTGRLLARAARNRLARHGRLGGRRVSLQRYA